MTVITHQAQPITQYDEVRPAHSSVHGFVGSLAKEHPSWHIRLADLEDGGISPQKTYSACPATVRVKHGCADIRNGTGLNCFRSKAGRLKVFLTAMEAYMSSSAVREASARFGQII